MIANVKADLLLRERFDFDDGAILGNCDLAGAEAGGGLPAFLQVPIVLWPSGQTLGGL
jgi:hypothetical protein